MGGRSPGALPDTVRAAFEGDETIAAPCVPDLAGVPSIPDLAVNRNTTPKSSGPAWSVIWPTKAT